MKPVITLFLLMTSMVKLTTGNLVNNILSQRIIITNKENTNDASRQIMQNETHQADQAEKIWIDEILDQNNKMRVFKNKRSISPSINLKIAANQQLGIEGDKIASEVINKVLKFISGLKRDTAKLKAYQSLLKAALSLRLESGQILKINEKINEFLISETSLEMKKNPQFKNLVDKQQEAVDSVAKKWAGDIQGGNFTEILKSAEENRVRFLELIDKIITNAYGNGSGNDQKILQNNLNQILDFTSKLTWSKHQAMCYQSLISNMKATSNMDSPALLQIEAYIDDALNTHPEPEFRQIKTQIDESKPKMIENIGRLIRSGAHDMIVEFTKNHRDQLWQHLDAMTTAAYNQSDESAVQIVEYVSKITQYYDDVIKIYTRLYEEMDKAGKISLAAVIRMAYSIHFLMNTREISDFDKDRYATLWNKFPQEIQAIVSGKRVCINNAAFNAEYYLIVKDHYDDDRNQVYLAKDWKSDSLTSYQWVFENNYGGRILEIKSVISDDEMDYMYATSSFSYGETMSRVFTWQPGDRINQGLWELRTGNYSANEYYVYNWKHHEYMNADDSEEMDNAAPEKPTGFRRVYTWRTKDEHGPNPLWKINAC